MPCGSRYGLEPAHGSRPRGWDRAASDRRKDS